MRNLKLDKDVIEQMAIIDVPPMYSETVALHAIDRAVAAEMKLELAVDALEEIHGITQQYYFPAIEVISEQTLKKIKTVELTSAKDKLIHAQVEHVDTVNAELTRLQEENKRLRNNLKVTSELLSTTQSWNSCLVNALNGLRGDIIHLKIPTEDIIETIDSTLGLLQNKTPGDLSP